MNGESDLALAEARFGIEVEQFLNSQIGQYLIGRAEIDEREALESLGEVDPEDTKSIRQAQFKLQVARSVPRWIQDAIQSGRIAQATIEVEDSHE
jgi:hypothetical protein